MTYFGCFAGFAVGSFMLLCGRASGHKNFRFKSQWHVVVLLVASPRLWNTLPVEPCQPNIELVMW